MNSNATSDIEKKTHQIGQDAAQLVRERIVQPVTQFAHDARDSVVSGVKQAQGFVSDSATAAGKTINKAVGKTQDIVISERDRAGAWVSNNPFLAVAAAAVVGWVVGAVRHSSHR